MMGTLHELVRHKVPIIVLNPLRELALERFTDAQNVIEIATYSSTNIASSYFQVKSGGDAAALKGIMKTLLVMDAELGNVVDHDFIAAHTQGFERFAADLAPTPLEVIEKECGLTQAEIEQVAIAYAKSKATIITYGHGHQPA